MFALGFKKPLLFTFSLQKVLFQLKKKQNDFSNESTKGVNRL
jgi:hypothetical protein